jgi:hypothetical protein
MPPTLSSITERFSAKKHIRRPGVELVFPEDAIATMPPPLPDGTLLLMIESPSTNHRLPPGLWESGPLVIRGVEYNARSPRPRTNSIADMTNGVTLVLTTPTR